MSCCALEGDVEALRKAAAEAFRSRDFESALSLYTRAIGLAPDAKELHSNRAACRAATKDYRGSLSDAEECIRVAPEWGKGWLRKGAALHGMGCFGDAAAAFEQAASTSSNPLLQPEPI